jgi:hypothetical protein
LAIVPSLASGSDFSPLAAQAMYIIAIICGGAIVLGIVTSGLLVYVFRRKWIWLLITLFAVGWGAIGFGVLNEMR